MENSELQKKGIDLADSLHALPLVERLGIIARTFGCESAAVETSLCTGKWRGYTDIGIKLDNSSYLWIGTHRTPQAKTAKKINECVNGALARFHPDIVRETIDRATTALTKRETEDRAAAERMGLKAYTFLNVELNDGSNPQSGGYLGWYYVTMAVDGNIFGFIESGLASDIARGELPESNVRPNYYVAGGLQDNEVDFVFDNVGHSSFKDSYKIELPIDARERAEKTLAARINGADAHLRPSALGRLAAAKEAVAQKSAEKAGAPKDKSRTEDAI